MQKEYLTEIKVTYYPNCFRPYEVEYSLYINNDGIKQLGSYVVNKNYTTETCIVFARNGKCINYKYNYKQQLVRILFYQIKSLNRLDDFLFLQIDLYDCGNNYPQQFVSNIDKTELFDNFVNNTEIDMDCIFTNYNFQYIEKYVYKKDKYVIEEFRQKFLENNISLI